MATKSRSVEVLIKARDEASGVLRNLKGPLIALGATAAAITAAFVGLGIAFKKAVDTASAQQQADVKLAAALRTTGQNTKETREELNAFAGTLQDLTITDDRVVKSISGVLASLGELHGDKLKRATAATLDFAAALGQDANAAALLVAKASGGMVSVLSRYGLTIDENIPKNEQFNAVLTEMEKKFGGIAEAMGKTFAGKLARVTNDLNDAAEQIGDIVVRSTAFNDILDALSTTAKGFQNNLRGSDKVMKDFETALVSITLTTGRLLVEMGDLALGILQTITFVSRFRVMSGFLVLLPETAGVTALRESLELFRDTLGTLDRNLQNTQDNLARIAELERIIAREGVASAAGLRALAEMRALTEDVETVEEALGNLPAPVKETTEALSELDTLLKAIGTKGIEELKAGAEEVKTAFDAAVAAFSEGVGEDKTFKSEEQFDKVIENIKRVGQAIRESGGDIADFLTTGGRIPEELTPLFASMEEKVNSLGDTINEVVASQGSNAAKQFGGALVDAAFGAKQAWDQFFTQLIKMFLKAIVQAIILNALTGGGGSAFGAIFGGGGGGGDIFTKIGGGLLVGAAPTLPVPVSASPAAGLPIAAAQPASTFNVGVFPAPDAREDAIRVLDQINELAERAGFKVVATEILSGA